MYQYYKFSELHNLNILFQSFQYLVPCIFQQNFSSFSTHLLIPHFIITVTCMFQPTRLFQLKIQKYQLSCYFCLLIFFFNIISFFVVMYQFKYPFFFWTIKTCLASNKNIRLCSFSYEIYYGYILLLSLHIPKIKTLIIILFCQLNNMGISNTVVNLYITDFEINSVNSK